MTTQTWWLSFCDAERPEGTQFLGAAIVDVTAADAEAAAPILTIRRAEHGLPPSDDPEAPWMAAAIRLSHARGCNPGGEVGAIRIDRAPAFKQHDALLPRDRLLSRAELDALGLL